MEKPWRTRMREQLPFGCWLCDDGTEILFDKHHNPLWQRSGPGQPAERATARPDTIVDERRFYSRETLPWRDSGSLRRCRAVLEDWGVPAPPM